MNQANQQKARILPMRRVALLATTVAGLAVGGFLVSPTLLPYAPVAHAQNLSQEAQNVARQDADRGATLGIVRRRESVPQRLADGEVLQALRHA
jgi:hypothetical protein